MDCWAHVRRPFYEISVAGDSPIAREALERIRALFAIEAEICGRSADERRTVRQTRAGPLLDDLHRSCQMTHPLITEGVRMYIVPGLFLEFGSGRTDRSRLRARAP